jgi:apolipoprotein D and lipocalin family protein
MNEPSSPLAHGRWTILAFLSAVGALLCLAGCATSKPAPLKTVAHVDLPKYQGDWRVISNIPYFAEKDCVDSIESYYPRKDGKMDNYFTYRKKSFSAPQQQFRALASVYNTKTNAEWRVRFLPFVVADYLILDLDPNPGSKYQWTAVGHPSRDYGWIMARSKTMPEKTYQAILRRLAAQGYDPARFVKVPQVPPPVPRAR